MQGKDYSITLAREKASKKENPSIYDIISQEYHGRCVRWISISSSWSIIYCPFLHFPHTSTDAVFKLL